MTSPLERWNQAWENSTITVVYNAESDIYFVSIEGPSIARARKCNIPQVFAASDYETMPELELSACLCLCRYGKFLDTVSKPCPIPWRPLVC